MAIEIERVTGTSGRSRVIVTGWEGMMEETPMVAPSDGGRSLGYEGLNPVVSPGRSGSHFLCALMSINPIPILVGLRKIG